MAKQVQKTQAKISADYLIYSSLTCGQTYVRYANMHLDLPTVEKAVTIKGGAGVMQKRALITPYGVMTEVTETDYEFLQTVPQFNAHVAGGWIKVIKAKMLRDDPDSVAADMEARDGAAPLVPADFDHLEQRARPIVNGTRSDGSEPTTRERTRPFIHSVGGMQSAFR